MKGSKRLIRPGVYELRVYRPQHEGGPMSRTWPRKVDGVRPKGSATGADAALRKLIKDVEDGKHRPQKAGTVAQVLERWLKDRHRDWAPRTASENRAFVKRYLAPTRKAHGIGDIEATKVRPADLKKLYAHLVDTVGIPTARRAHTHLRAAFEEAVSDGELAANPCARVRAPKAGAKAEREVSIGQVVEVMRRAVAAEDMSTATLIRVALATGARRGELGALRWSDVDLDAGLVTIGRALTLDGGEVVVKSTKAGNTKRLAIDAGTVEMLRRWHDECEMDFLAGGLRLAPSWFVWGGRTPTHPDKITRRWVALRNVEPKIDLRFHDIRHATGSFMASAGVGFAEGAARLGNTNEVYVGTYTHADPEKSRPIAELIGAEIDRVLES